MTERQTQRAAHAWTWTRSIVLSASVVSSALLMAVSVGATDASWVVWISLVPLFWAIRALSPAAAALAGAVWGLCLYFFCIVGPGPPVSPAGLSVFLLVTVSATYAGLGSLLTRAGGFNPILLGLAWALMETALRPLGLGPGILAPVHGEATWLDWVARVFGCALVSFLVAFVNASLLAVLSGAELRIAGERLLIDLCSPGGCCISQARSLFQRWLLRLALPRGPPPDNLADDLWHAVEGVLGRRPQCPKYRAVPF